VPVYDLPATELEKVLSGLGLGKLSEDDANKVLANLRYNNGGSTQFAADMKSYKEDLELYESKKASLLQQHPYADGKRGGYHAEDAFLSAWTEFKKSKIYQDIKEAGKGKFYVSLKLSKTPCEKCTPRLIKFVRDEKDVKLRIKAQRIYTKKGETLVEGVSRMQELIASGIPVKAWMLEERVGKKATTKELQLHELSFWDFKPLDPQEVLFMKDLKDKLAASTKQINLYLPGKGPEKYNADRDYKSASRHSEEGKVGKIVI
jgi:hypothetical protein